MTNAEQKLMKKEKTFVSLRNLVERTRKVIEIEVAEREKDKYFADSWEQSEQIDRDIDRCKENLLFLEKIEKNFRLHMKPCAKELSRFKGLAIKAI